MDCKTDCVKTIKLGKEKMSKQQKMRIQFHLITILIQNQAVHHPNQHHHILDHGHPKKGFEKIKKLHIRCDGSDYIKQLYMLPSRWISLLEYDILGDAICENFQNASCTPIESFVEENLGNWHPKTHGPRKYFHSFYLAALINKCRKKYIHMLRF